MRFIQIDINQSFITKFMLLWLLIPLTASVLHP